jgi:hypothetical protein
VTSKPAKVEVIEESKPVLKPFANMDFLDVLGDSSESDET